MTHTTESDLLKRIEKLEAQLASQTQANEERRTEHVTSRRGMLRLAGAAAVGGLAAAVIAEPAAATDGAAVLAGVAANTATVPTGISVLTPGGADLAYGLACYEAGLGALTATLGRPAVFGHATDAAFSTGVGGHNVATGGRGVVGVDDGIDGTSVGVQGISANGTGMIAEGAGTGLIASGGNYGVYGQGNSGIGMASQGIRGALRLDYSNVPPPPSRGTSFEKYTLETDGAGNVWYCYENGTPGKWRKLAGPATGGAFHPITPTRVYDSRAAAPSTGLLGTGLNRTISVADGRDNNGTVITADLVPAGATAVAANVTVTGTTGTGGFLAVNPGGVTTVGASTINWFGAGQNLANGVTLTLNATRQLTVICGDGGGSTHFIIDIAGYYL